MNRGSLWRRWDLHIHTPASALANHYGDWDGYIAALETQGADVAALGVTDYFSIEGYKRTVEYKQKGRLQGFALILLNIELRTHPELANGRGINLHILVDPSDPAHVEHIERALGHLTFRYGGQDYACTTSELRRLGRAVDADQTDDWGAFKVGVNAFKPDFGDVRKWLETKGRWLRQHGVICVTNGKDGPSALSSDGGFMASRRELYRFADMIFSANPNDRTYFLGRGVDAPEVVIANCGSLKPCIHGSDAHEENKLFQPDNDRFCWIKADPTFEGLRQLLHEPADRVVIGPSPPMPSDMSKIIDKVGFTGADAWFTPCEVPLNSGLVAIIGEKGSGKTAFAELISFATSSWASRGMPASFISKAGPSLDDLTITVTWMDGHVSRRRIGATVAETLPEVRYLSQDFVEELCSSDVSGGRLIREIEEVVFGYIDEGDRLGATDFTELRRIKTEGLIEKKRGVTATISSLNREIIQIETRLSGRPEKQQLLERAIGEKRAIESQIPNLLSTVDMAVAAELQALEAVKRDKTTQLAALRRSITRLGTVRGKAVDYLSMVMREFTELRPHLVGVGLTEAEADAFKPVLPDTVLVPFEPLQTMAEEAARTLAGDPEHPSATGETLADIELRLGSLRSRLATDEQQRLRLVDLQQQLSKLESDIRRLEADIRSLDGEVAGSLIAKRDERWTAYLSYFDLIVEERTTLASLYEPLAKVIAEDPSGTKAGFELDVRISVAPESWIETGKDMFDKRRAGLALLDPILLKEAEKTLFEHWRTADQAEIRATLERFLDQVGAGDALDPLLNAHASRDRVYDWMFSTDHITLDYGLRYNGTDLDRLSPGTRGIVLLVLYLAMDKQDRRPLVIDQPEGNLDNSSVFEALVPFLRQARHSRQVILVTHNPNLVVTTDADQVIVARAERPLGARHPRLGYTAGALEDASTEDAIRQQTITLLEGGTTPFRMRGDKYSMATR